MASNREATNTVDVTSGLPDHVLDETPVSGGQQSFSSHGAKPPVSSSSSGDHQHAPVPKSASDLAFDDGGGKKEQALEQQPEAPKPKVDKAEEKKEKKAKPGTEELRHGLIHGTYIEESNSIDLHVDAKGDGAGMSPLDMLVMAQQCRHLMTEREQAGGPQGKFMLHPTGAAITKMFIELLGASLGGWANKAKAGILQAKRKNFGSAPDQRNPDKLGKDVQPEHFAFLDSMRGSDVAITPRMTGKYNTEANYDQNMMEKTDEGNARYGQYKESLGKSDEEEPMGPSLDVTLTSAQLPAVIAKLQEQVKKM